MRNFMLFCAAFCLAACSPFIEINRTQGPRDPARDSLVRDTLVFPDPPQTPGKITIWSCGVQVPDNYNWQQDSLCGKQTECRVFVYKDSLMVLDIPAGEQNEIGLDADEHFLVNGNLYTSFTAEDCTVIKKNGEELLRFPGRERLFSVMERGEAVWCLSKKLSAGGGFSLRRASEGLCTIIKETDGGVPAGPLHEDGGSLFFYHHGTGAQDGSQPWYMCMDGIDVPIAGKGGMEIAAARRWNSKTWTIRYTRGSVSLLQDNQICSTIQTSGAAFMSAELDFHDGKLGACAFVKAAGTNLVCIWDNALNWKVRREDDLYRVVFSEKGDRYIYNSPSAEISYRYLDHSYAIDGEWKLIGGNFCDSYQQLLAMGLSAAHGKGCALCCNTKLTRLDINGYITGVWLEPRF